MAPSTISTSPPSGGRVDWRVHGALLLVQIVFGGFHVTAKWVFAELEPLELASLRAAGAMPIYAAAAVLSRSASLPSVRLWPWIAGLGLMGVAANQLLFISGLEFTTATNAAILMPSIPVFALAVGMITGIERVGSWRIAGIVLAALGALVMVSPTQFQTGGDSWLGNLLILGNCLCYASFLVFQRPLLRRLSPLTVISGAFIFGGVAILAVTWRQLTAVVTDPPSAAAWLGVAYIVLGPTVLAYGLNTWAVKRSSPTLAATYITFQPVMTAILAGIFLGETVGWDQAAGFVLIVGGLLTVSTLGRQREARPVPVE